MNNPEGHLRVLGYREYHRYYNRVDRCPAGMLWVETDLGVAVEVRLDSFEHICVTNELTATARLPVLSWPISALCLHAERLFAREDYAEFTDIIVQHPAVGDYILAPKSICRYPQKLALAQAAVRYIRVTRAARAALQELQK
ncbi:MAG: hypothetical protein H7228_15195 [Polaromonas sp.]|nr:hypothetical protein [Polaromonas sp.]